MTDADGDSLQTVLAAAAEVLTTAGVYQRDSTEDVLSPALDLRTYTAS